MKAIGFGKLVAREVVLGRLGLGPPVSQTPL